MASEQLHLGLSAIIVILALIIAVTVIAAYYIINSNKNSKTVSRDEINGESDLDKKSKTSIVTDYSKARIPKVYPEER